MKKIMMTGDFNSITENIYNSLLNRFHVQFCPDDTELFEKMYGMTSPELVLCSLIGVEEREQQKILVCMREKHAMVPVVCIGNQEELEVYGEVLSEKQFHELVRPITIREILENISKLLGMKMSYGEARSADKKRILIIDDSPLQLRTMKGLLQKEFEVGMATSAKEAMHLISRELPDLIFLDYDMPQCDGRETFEMLKKDPMSRDVPVVFLTGIGERKKVLSVLSMYPADYLLKPVEKEKIIETIHNIIGF